MKDILGVVVLYHPGRELEHRIVSYIDHVTRLLVIDNSEPPVQWVKPLLSAWTHKIDFIENSSNQGIGQPLNVAASIAARGNYQWLLTMDQDSEFQAGSLEELKAVADGAEPNVALVSPFHHTPNAPAPAFTERIKPIRLTMTSGNLLRVQAWQKAGPFEEKLFIDSIDHEYYLRLRNLGYRIIRANRSVLLHPLGDIQYTRLLFLKLKTTNHPAIRRYYITRNRLYVGFKYALSDFWFFFREMRELIKSFFIVLLLDRDRRKKLSMMLKGVWHFLKGRYGRLES